MEIAIKYEKMVNVSWVQMGNYFPIQNDTFHDIISGLPNSRWHTSNHLPERYFQGHLTDENLVVGSQIKFP